MSRKPVAASRPPRRVTILISDDVHTRLKTVCAARRVRMATVLRDWIEQKTKSMEAVR